MDTVTAMALSPDDKYIVVVGSAYAGGAWSVDSLIFTIRASDGGH